MERKTLGIIAVYLAMTANAMSFTIYYPFGSHMVMSFGMTENRSSTGYYVGLLSLSMMGGRTLFSPIWGSICDRYGRKVVMILSVTSVCIFSIAFGLSWNYWFALFSLFCLGGFCGCGIVGKVLITEYTNGNPKAQSAVVLSWQVGNILGNISGGALSQPVQKGYTSIKFLEQHPYLLPNLVVSLLGFISLLICLLYLDETLDLKKEKNIDIQVRSYRQLLKEKHIQIVISDYMIQVLVIAGFNELINLWCWSSKENGGFEMNTTQIGMVLGISVIILLVVEFLIIRCLIDKWKISLQKRIKKANIAAVVTIICIPVAAFTSPYKVISYVTVSISCILWWLNTFVMASSHIILQNNCVSNYERGRLSGATMTANSISKSISPIVLGSIFASTSTSGFNFPLNYSACFLIMGLLLLVAFSLKFFIPKNVYDPSSFQQQELAIMMAEENLKEKSTIQETY